MIKLAIKMRPDKTLVISGDLNGHFGKLAVAMRVYTVGMAMA